MKHRGEAQEEVAPDREGMRKALRKRNMTQIADLKPKTLLEIKMAAIVDEIG